jgi:hypothetical protein
MESDAQCKNYELCQSEAPVWFLEGHGNRCINCYVSYWANKGEWSIIRDAVQDEHCSICLEHVNDDRSPIRMLKFPAYECLHWFCIKCSRTIIGYSNSNIWTKIDPITYGCPPCPCKRTTGVSCKARPCNNDDDDNILDAWELSSPCHFNRWNEDEIELEHKLHTTNQVFRRCPVCKRKAI